MSSITSIGVTGARFVRRRMLTPSIFHLDFVADSQPLTLDFQPGQWADVFFPDIEQVGGFSFTSKPEDLPNFSLAVKDSITSPPAKWLARDAEVPARILLRPGGNVFWEGDPDRNLLCIAGGIGITPLFSILEAFAARRSKGKVALIYSSPVKDEMAYAAELEDLEQAMSGVFKFLPVFTRERGSRINEDEILHAMEFLDGGESQSPEAFLCGPTGFCEAYDDMITKSLALDVEVRYEKWW